MKVCCLLLTLLGINHVQAQAPDPTRQYLDNLVAPLDKTQVPTGFLAEYAVPLVPLDVFNGTLTDSSRTNPDGFRFIYTTVYSAWLGSGNNPLPSPLELNSRLEAATAANTAIPVMVQHIDYATVRPDAFDTGLLSFQNNQLLDVAGRPQSPYLNQTLFAAAPATTYSPTGDVTLVFPSTLDIERGTGSGQTLSVDFGDGLGYVNAAWNQPVTAHYATAGTWRVKVRVIYSSGGVIFDSKGRTKLTESGGRPPIWSIPTYTSYESQFDMRVASPSAVAALRNTAKRTNTASDLVIPISSPVFGYGAKVTIHYANGHTSLTNPLIVVEGYDKNRIAPAIQEKNYDLAEFLTDITTSPTFNFNDALANGANGSAASQYDIVFIDFYNGTGNILINAVIFEQVLNEVQQRKVGTAQNVVMGMSMGGLIARYKLADMTKAGRDPHTRLLILQDSPQRGANVPLGIQALTRQMMFNLPLVVLTPWGLKQLNTADLSPTIKQGNLLLDEPATTQMLVHTATDATGGFAANTFIAGTYHNMIAGDTAPGRAYTVVAASQGSQCGQGLFAPHTELIKVNGEIGISPLPWIVRGGLSAEAIVNALPANGQADRVSHLAFKIRIRLFRFIRITIPLLDRSYSCPAGLLALDGVAGSTEDIVTGGVNMSGNFNSWPVSVLLGLPIVNANWNVAVVPQFCFLPTASALDVPLTSQVLQGVFSSGIGTPVQPQLNSFIAQEGYAYGNGTRYNKPHLAFTPRNTEWMYNVMEGMPFANSFCASGCNPAANLAVSGPSTICALSTYTSPLQGPGYIYTWTATPANLFTVSSGSGPTFQTANATSSGIGTIQLTVNTGCSTVFTRRVSMGKPAIPFFTYSEPLSMCYGKARTGNFQVSHPEPGQTYRCDFIDRSTGSVELTRGGPLFYFNSAELGPGVYTLAMTASDVCGSTTYSSVHMTINDCGGGGMFRTATLYPNPAKETVDVHIENADAAHPVTVRLFDGYGRPRAEQTSTGAASVRLATDKLPAGLYFVHILRGNKVMKREQLRIEK